MKGKKKEIIIDHEATERALKHAQEYLEWRKNPVYPTGHPFGETEAEKAWIADYERKQNRNRKITGGALTLRAIIVTPLALIFRLLTIIAKASMYVSVIFFFYACYKIIKGIIVGNGIISAISSRWYFLIIPFAASFLYYLFDKLYWFCSDNGLN